MSDKKNHPLFVIDADGPVKWPVLVRIPADGGEFALFQFTGVFKRMSEEEYEAIMATRKEKLPEIGSAEQVELIAGKSRAELLEENAALFPQLMTGWEDVRDATGTEVAFTQAVLHKQITGVNGMHLSVALWTAIHEIRNGARLGN